MIRSPVKIIISPTWMARCKDAAWCKAIMQLSDPLPSGEREISLNVARKAMDFRKTCPVFVVQSGSAPSAPLRETMIFDLEQFPSL